MLQNPKFWLAMLAGVIALGYLALKVLATTAKKPERAENPGALEPCPDSPNCVCSEDARESHTIDPLSYEGDDAAAWSKLQSVLKNLGGKEVRAGDEYLWFEFRTKLVGFVDDVECRLNPDKKQIEIRSASRVGYSDLGANRKRVNAIRKAFQSRS